MVQHFFITQEDTLNHQKSTDIILSAFCQQLERLSLDSTSFKDPPQSGDKN